VRERRRVALFWSQRPERTDGPDLPAVLDLREALQRLPFRKRACVVLRHAFDLSERDTAAALGISVGTVKSQTSRGIAELERLLEPWTAEAGTVQGAGSAAADGSAGPERLPRAGQPEGTAGAAQGAAGDIGPGAQRLLGAAGPATRARTRTGRGM
jgi:sigma-70-like protein